ncbi:hypothetical protein V501_10401 [Pseudogymnoascus sp. VKM F-4519 (FW-2642)]|nr:hypothetical protein V501_10401 [Pseudogymnoascus sp. VKM F-4519 (FW-2642)]
MILLPKHAALQHTPTEKSRSIATSWCPVSRRTNHLHVNMSIPTPKPRKRRLSLSEIDESPAIDAAIDIFQKSQSSIIVSLPETGCFDTMVQRVEETMALVDKRGISLAHKAKRRRIIAERLSERKHGVENNPLFGEIGRPKNTPLALSSDQTTTKNCPTCRIQKQTQLLPPKAKRDTTTQNISPMLAAMISEVEAQSQNNKNMSEEYSEDEDSKPEILVVEKEYSPLKIRIVKAPERNGGYIIAKSGGKDWMLELGMRLEKEEKERKERDEEEGCEVVG